MYVEYDKKNKHYNFSYFIASLVIYTFYELSNLSENEKFLENIYSEQLNTIIFSVNQNVDDVLQSWSGKINDINQSPDSEFVKKK